MHQNCRLPGSHRLWPAFPRSSANSMQSDLAALQPHSGRDRRGLGSSPFARHYLGNHCYFLFLQVLRCFSSLRLPLWVKPISSRLFQSRGCPIRKCLDHRACAPPRALSQLIASFIASETLGIPRVLLLTSLSQLPPSRDSAVLRKEPARCASFLLPLTSKNVYHSCI